MGGIPHKKVFTEAETDRSAEGLGRISRLDFAHSAASMVTAPQVKEPLIRASSKRPVIWTSQGI